MDAKNLLSDLKAAGGISLNLDKWPKPPRKIGNRYLYGTTLFWAENGAVYLEETHPDKHGTENRKRESMPLRKWADRFMATCENYQHQAMTCHQAGNIRQQASAVALRDALKGLMEAMKVVALEARRQGDILDPKVQKHYDTHVAPVKRTHLVTHQTTKDGLILPH